MLVPRVVNFWGCQTSMHAGLWSFRCMCHGGRYIGAFRFFVYKMGSPCLRLNSQGDYIILYISYYIILYHIISYYIILDHVILYYIILFHILSFYIILYHIISYYIRYIILYHVISIHLFVYPSLYLSIIYLSIYLSICLSIYLSVCLSVCLSVYLSIYIYLSLSLSLSLSLRTHIIWGIYIYTWLVSCIDTLRSDYCCYCFSRLFRGLLAKLTTMPGMPCLMRCLPSLLAKLQALGCCYWAGCSKSSNRNMDSWMTWAAPPLQLLYTFVLCFSGLKILNQMPSS